MVRSKHVNKHDTNREAKYYNSLGDSCNVIITMDIKKHRFNNILSTIKKL